MEKNVYAEYQQSPHYNNRTGVRATCPDCHVPKAWYPMLIRKISASNEVFHKLLGSVDTPEKFNAKRHILAQHVWQDMKATDSRECRNCHDFQHMSLQDQSTKAQIFHANAAKWDKTCIDCHKGISHALPAEYKPQDVMDELHEYIERDNITCYQCHEQMARPAAGDGW
jgi:cytochrome c-type protein NapC